MHSLCVNNEKEKLHFHIIVDDTVNERQKEELRTVVPKDGEISFYLINIDNIREYLIVKVENFPIPIYYRLLMAKILPLTVHKVLYLDADMIVRHDLSELWNTPLENLAVAGVSNQSNCGCYWERLSYKKEQGYFNSGVLLFNLDYIREKQLTEQFIDYIKSNPEKLLCPDQDVLNYVLRESKKHLSVYYNAQEGFYREPPEMITGQKEEFQKAIQDPAIVHYTKEKPWTKGCTHPLRNLYYYYKKDTVWANNNYMEKFRYKKIHTPIIFKIKIFLANLIGIINRNKTQRIVYLNIHLDK